MFIIGILNTLLNTDFWIRSCFVFSKFFFLYSKLHLYTINCYSIIQPNWKIYNLLLKYLALCVRTSLNTLERLSVSYIVFVFPAAELNDCQCVYVRSCSFCAILIGLFKKRRKHTSSRATHSAFSYSRRGISPNISVSLSERALSYHSYPESVWAVRLIYSAGFCFFVCTSPTH